MASEEPVLARAARQHVLRGVVEDGDVGPINGKEVAGVVARTAADSLQVGDARRVVTRGGPLGKDRGQSGRIVVECRPAGNENVVVSVADDPVRARSANQNMK